MTNTQPTFKIGVTLILAACGMAFLVHMHPERLKAPEWVALLAVGLFGVAGACITAQALRFQRLVRWLICVLLGAMAIVPAWIALGAGGRQCTVLSLGASAAVSEAACRGAFGAGALVIVVFFVIAVRGAVRAWHTG